MNYIIEGPEYVSMQNLAAELGCDPLTLNNRMRKLGITAEYRDFSDGRKRLVKRTDAAPLFTIYGPKKGNANAST